MPRKTLATLSLLTATLVLLTALAACASLKLPGAQAGAQQTPGMNFANQPIESKLAMGTLKLEGTANAITTQQAKDLLPLWKAVKSMSASTTTSQQEMDALYKQIQDTMTAGQVQAIKDMQLKPEDYQALMKQYTIQPPQGGPQGGDFGSLSESERATRVAQFRSQNGGGNGNGNGNRRGNNNGGGFPGGGMPPDGGGFPGGQAGGQNGGQAGQSTPRAPQGSRGFRGGGMNNMFVDPLIKLLQEKAK